MRRLRRPERQKKANDQTRAREYRAVSILYTTLHRVDHLYAAEQPGSVRHQLPRAADFVGAD
jgi:hypothetical protein